MRYIKVLVLAACIFLALVFFFQNQAGLSTEIKLTMNLFFIPPMTSISLPFYFIVAGAFLVGCALSAAFLFWDKCTLSARLVKTKWRVSSLEKQVGKLNNQVASHEAAKAAAPAGKVPLAKDPGNVSGAASAAKPA